jgi:hypothetical protein
VFSKPIILVDSSSLLRTRDGKPIVFILADNIRDASIIVACLNPVRYPLSDTGVPVSKDLGHQD